MTAARDTLLRGFTARCGWADTIHAPLAGDASNRRYLRLTSATGTRAVVMDAPPEKGEDTHTFLQIAVHLRRIGLRAPEILAADPDTGFILLEDLGDALFARVLEQDASAEETLYAAAIDVLAALHTAPLPAGIGAYSPAVMADLGAFACDWYAPDGTDRAPLQTALQDILDTHAPDTNVLILSDYHAENLLWMPEEEGISAVGLLDFQDALAGHPAYDLVSLLKDARRDVPAAIEAAMIDRFITTTGADAQSFYAAYAALGAQRNLRILGVFARLCLRDGKPGYLALIPRVWAHLQACLASPALADLRPAAGALPEPTPDILAALEAQCPTR